jgi:hypothetical protein
MNRRIAPCAAVALLAASACTTVRQLRDPAQLTANGVTEKTRTDQALDYSVAIKIAASPEALWVLLTDASQYTAWNSTIIKLEGTIAPGGQLKLTSIDKPDKVFDLKVSAFEVPKHMVWEDGGMMFLGVRHFTLLPQPDRTTVFAMSETFSGGMLGMIEGSLPDFTKTFSTFAADLKKKAEAPASAATR